MGVKGFNIDGTFSSIQMKAVGFPLGRKVLVSNWVLHNFILKEIKKMTSRHKIKLFKQGCCLCDDSYH